MGSVDRLRDLGGLPCVVKSSAAQEWAMRRGIVVCIRSCVLRGL